MASIRNLTPHAIHLIGERETVVLTPDGPPARVALNPDRPAGHVRVREEMRLPLGEHGLPGEDVFPIVVTSWSAEVTDLPEAEPGVLLLVARPVAEARPQRDDLVFPHDSVRNEQGQVVGCRSLASLATDPVVDPAPWGWLLDRTTLHRVRPATADEAAAFAAAYAEYDPDSCEYVDLTIDGREVLLSTWISADLLADLTAGRE